jgi:hypothetical protein
VDILYLTKTHDDKRHYLNMVRIAADDSQNILFRVNGIPSKELNEIQTYQNKHFNNTDENFVLQFKDQSAAYHLTFCGFDEKFVDGKCHACPKKQFNLDPQGATCAKCYKKKSSFTNLNVTMDFVRDEICFPAKKKEEGFFSPERADQPEEIVMDVLFATMGALVTALIISYMCCPTRVELFFDSCSSCDCCKDDCCDKSKGVYVDPLDEDEGEGAILIMLSNQTK